MSQHRCFLNCKDRISDNFVQSPYEFLDMHVVNHAVIIIMNRNYEYLMGNQPRCSIRCACLT